MKKKLNTTYKQKALTDMRQHGFVLEEPLIADNNRHKFFVNNKGELRKAWYIATFDYVIPNSLLVSYGLLDDKESFTYFSHANKIDELEDRILLGTRYL